MTRGLPYVFVSLQLSPVRGGGVASETGIAELDSSHAQPATTNFVTAKRSRDISDHSRARRTATESSASLAVTNAYTRSHVACPRCSVLWLQPRHGESVRLADVPAASREQKVAGQIQASRPRNPPDSRSTGLAAPALGIRL